MNAGERGEAGPGSVYRGMVAIVAAGFLLGVVYNLIGLRSGWGIPWVGEDPSERLASLETVSRAGGPVPGAGGYTTDVTDPLAVPAAAALPPIPDVGRPVQIELGALEQYVEAEAAVIVDAREASEYADGHIPGAINLPYDEVVSDPARLESLDAGGRPIITYCGGGGCEQSLHLADELIFAGHSRVAVYMGGFPEWVAAGRPVE